MSDAPTPSEVKSTAPAQKKSKLLLIIIVVVLLVAGGGGFFFYTKSSAAPPAEGAKAEKSKKKGSKAAAEEDAADDEEEPSSEEKSHTEGKSGATASTGKPSTKKVLQLSLPEDGEVKEVVELQPFIVNLADSEEARYLRMTVNLGIGDAGGHKPDAIFTTRIRNAMLAVLTNKTSKELLTVEGKTALRKELLRAARAASDEPHVEAIYITDFIVQL